MNTSSPAPGFCLLACGALFLAASASGAAPVNFFEKHCTECHDADAKKGNLDLTALKPDFADTLDTAEP